MQLLYEVVVCNELTGEVERVRLTSSCSQEAQVDALVHLFKEQGWRKAVAWQAELAVGASETD
jgi:hypothetical protein